LHYAAHPPYASKRNVFKQWIKESYSIRQLTKISGYARNTLFRICEYWLSKEPPALSKIKYAEAKYLLFDGTYFNKQGCLILIIDIVRKRVITSAYIPKESYRNVINIFKALREQGLNPVVFTLDGHKEVTKAILEIWPQVTIQRCLFHIKNQGLMWIRYRPKTEAAWHMKQMLYSVTDIQTKADRDLFLATFKTWCKRYATFIASLPKNDVKTKDLKRTRALIANALPNMFHYLDDNNIASTTNYLEGFNSQVKHHYRNHRGLTEKHKIPYLKWYCFFKND
jgi:hypothetical protein